MQKQTGHKMANLTSSYSCNKANARPYPPNLSDHIRNTYVSISHMSQLLAEYAG